ncbi:MAG TPA: VWA domain-containing protein [Blastocatellia bacterium]|nr:VWA domain-containing protein [Blastocatellia bacterium]
MKVKEIVGIKNLRRILLIFLFGALSLHLSTPTNLVTRAVTAQRSRNVQKSLAQEHGETIKINSSLVSVPVSVTDAAGRPVSNLTAEDFQLEEEGKMQQVVTLGNPGKTPVEIALLFDITGSVFDLFQFQRQAALRFLREALKPTDAVSIFTIGVRPKLVRSRVVGVNKAISAAQTIEPTKEATSFFDTVVEAAQYLDRTAAPGARRVVVVISDGEDMLSENYRLSDAMKELQRCDCLFYSINPSGPSIRLNKISTRGQDGMASLASATGGAAFLPEGPKDLDEVFGRITGELQAQYLLGYYSTDERADGRFRKITVRVPRRHGLHLRARQGYYASKT